MNLAKQAESRGWTGLKGSGVQLAASVVRRTRIMAEREQTEIDTDTTKLEETVPGRYFFSESGRYRAERIAMWIEEALAPMDI
jgi:hypothetical protein